MKRRETPYRELLRELGDSVEAHGLPVVRDFAAALLAVLQRHGEVRIPGMGTFRVRRRKARRIRAPGKAPAAERGVMELREGTEVRFRARREWKEALAPPESFSVAVAHPRPCTCVPNPFECGEGCRCVGCGHVRALDATCAVC